MHIVILEPFFTGSHAKWAQGYADHSDHQIDLLTLPGRHWKWRMHGGAISLARQFMTKNWQPDLIIATDMIDLTTFLALTRKKTANCRTVLYFHENQLTYPWSPEDRDPALQRDRHYAFVNYTSALAADQVLFNSQYHMNAFISELPVFLKAFPDFQESDLIPSLQQKSSVLPLGLDLRQFLPHKLTDATTSSAPLILWNHRWEYDKNPEEFFSTLFQLADEGLHFQVAVLGERFAQSPPIFSQIQRRLGERLIHLGFAPSFADYARWLWRADILPVTSQHDFFGISVVEAIYCGCYPLLPRRQAYPEHLPADVQSPFFYKDQDDLLQKTRQLLQNPALTEEVTLSDLVGRYDWQKQAPVYDSFFSQII